MSDGIILKPNRLKSIEVYADAEFAGNFLKTIHTHLLKFFLCSQMTLKEICGLGMWTQHSQNYVKAALPTIEEAIEHREYDIPMKAITPFSTKYSPELDTTPELDANHTRLCLEWVGILRWSYVLRSIAHLIPNR